MKYKINDMKMKQINLNNKALDNLVKKHNKAIVVYEIEKDIYGEGKDDEIYCGEFKNAGEVRDWLEIREKQPTSRQNINRAIKKGYVVLDKFLIFKLDLDEYDN